MHQVANQVYRSAVPIIPSPLKSHEVMEKEGEEEEKKEENKSLINVSVWWWQWQWCLHVLCACVHVWVPPLKPILCIYMHICSFPPFLCQQQHVPHIALHLVVLIQTGDGFVCIHKELSHFPLHPHNHSLLNHCTIDEQVFSSHLPLQNNAINYFVHISFPSANISLG